jgi:hypothetical protein
VNADAAQQPSLPRFPIGCTPVEQASLWIPHPLYDWQYNTLVAAAEPYSRVAQSTCNESGKTSVVGPVFVLSVMTAFPGARVFATSASERQVKEQLFEANLRPIVEKWPNTWRVTKSQMKIEHANGSVFLAYVCSDPKDVEGFHSKWAIDPRTGLKRWEPCAYLIDEAKGVPDEVYQAVLRINPYFMIAMSSPGEQHGFLYDAISPDTLQQA